MKVQTSSGDSGDSGGIETRARQYVAKIPPAISGQGGHSRTFSVAVALIHGFALTDPQAWPILCEFGATCLPPWSINELRHKLASAKTTGQTKAKGHLVGNTRAFYQVYSRPAPATPSHTIPLIKRLTLPAVPPVVAASPAPAPAAKVSTIVELPPELELSAYAQAQGPAWIAFQKRQTARMIADGWERTEFFDLTEQAEVEAFEKLYKRKL